MNPSSSVTDESHEGLIQAIYIYFYYQLHSSSQRYYAEY